MRAPFLYYKQINSFNIPFSLVVAFLAFLEGGSFGFFFFISLLSLGFILSLYLFEIRYANQYFLYFNLGFSRPKLIGFSFGVNAILAVTYFLVF